MSDELDGLRAVYPWWEMGARWVARRSAPDARMLYAKRDGIELRAWDVAGLLREIQVIEKSE